MVSVHLLGTFCAPRSLKIKFGLIRSEERITDLKTTVNLLTVFSQ